MILSYVNIAVVLLFCFRCFACVSRCSSFCVDCKFAAFAKVLCSCHWYPSFILVNHCVMIFAYHTFPHFDECCFFFFFSEFCLPFGLNWKRLVLMIKLGGFPNGKCIKCVCEEAISC